MLKTPQVALFDLDGTLLDTARDIASALNRTVAEYDKAAFSDEEVRRMIGRGSPVLIERAATARSMTLDEDMREHMLERFFHHYEEVEHTGPSSTRAYPGAQEVLMRLRARGVVMAVVTNKQQRFAVVLLERLGLAGLLDLIVGGDTCERRKPDPQPLLFACSALQVRPADAVMVGDSVNDAEAARAAGMPMVCMTYGYNEGRDPRELNCAAFLDSLSELPALLGLSP